MPKTTILRWHFLWLQIVSTIRKKTSCGRLDIGNPKDCSDQNMRRTEKSHLSNCKVLHVHGLLPRPGIPILLPEALRRRLSAPRYKMCPTGIFLLSLSQIFLYLQVWQIRFTLYIIKKGCTQLHARQHPLQMHPFKKPSLLTNFGHKKK